MDDAQIKRLRRAVDATPDDGNAQAALNAALRRMDIIRSFVSGRWVEWKRVFDGRSEIPGRIDQVLTVTSSDATFDQLLEAGRYQRISRDFSEDRFPLETHTGSRRIELVRFAKTLRAKQVRVWLTANELRPATIRELVEVGAQHRDMELSYPLVAFLGDEVAVISRPDETWRCLDVYPTGMMMVSTDEWSENASFAVVRLHGVADTAETAVESGKQDAKATEIWHRVIDADGKEIPGRIQKTLTVTLREAPLGELIIDGGYGYKANAIKANRFPLEASNGSLELALVQFIQPIRTSQVELWLKHHGFRPATLKELLALGAEHPYEQRNYRIVALGSRTIVHTHERMPTLSQDFGARRSLILCNDRQQRWPINYRFAAVRIYQPSATSQDVVADLPGTSAD